MAYKSVDHLQKVLVSEVFQYAKDSKKAAGRALGTIVEIITYYLIKTWGLNNHISIERGLEEYGNPDIMHNVEFSLHPVMRRSEITIDKTSKTLTSHVILKALEKSNFDLDGFIKKHNILISNNVLRNACTIANSSNSFLLCSIKSESADKIILHIYEQNKKPYSIIECKRVGVEEGMSKGPQTIEKAKQGAYVARSASSLQKIRNDNGDLIGVIYKGDGTYIIKPFNDLMDEVIFSNDKDLLRKFILTVGVVSNHGNWFTSTNHNKELKVLAQSYDWLLFLTDDGLSKFIEKLLLKPNNKYKPIRDAFISSYSATKSKNQFTKVQMNILADKLLLEYFRENINTINGWFNIISPSNKSINDLKKEINELARKNWTEILK